MIKKFLLVSVILSQLTISCSSNDDALTEDPVVTTPKEETLQEQIARISKQPYSTLTPADQKVKLEVEANDMLVQMDKSKTSGAIEAIQNLGNLLSINAVDIFGGKNGNEAVDVLNVADVYGIYTWDNAKQIWVKTPSTTELKFIFPAKIKGIANDATFTSNSIASTIKVKVADTYGYWSYDYETEIDTYHPSVNDSFFLPTSVNATLTIGGTQAATIVSNAKYSNGISAPDEASYKMVLNDGYTFEISGNKKATDNTGKASFTYNGKNLVEFVAGSTADIDGLLKDEPLVQYQGKANGLVKIMDNFIIVADTDIAGQTKDDEALEKTLPELNYYSKTYYTDKNTYNLKYSQGTVASFNKNVKAILVSKKDGTKIADVIARSEKGTAYNSNQSWIVDSESQFGGGYWNYNPNGGEIVQPYNEVYYLKFNDSTEVAMSAYFSEGFGQLETKFNDFLKSFNR